VNTAGFIAKALLQNVAFMAKLVPAARRAAWVAEWRAEFRALFRSRQELRAVEALSLAYGIARDAAGLRIGDVDEWAADLRSAIRAIACNRLSASCAVGLTMFTVVPLVALVFTGTRAIAVVVRHRAAGSHSLAAGIAVVGALCTWALLWLGARAVSSLIAPLTQAWRDDGGLRPLICPLVVVAAAPGSLAAAVWAAARVHAVFVTAASAGAYTAPPQASPSLVAAVASALLLAMSIVVGARLQQPGAPPDRVAP
jgi:hypothetical protein